MEADRRPPRRGRCRRAGTGRGRPERRARLVVDHLDALDEPDSLVGCATTAQAMLPRVDLPELLLEVHAWTGFLDAYTHLADVSTRIEDLAVCVAALLVAEACNVGLTPVIKPGETALTRARLAHVDQYYVRAENHAAANARLIEAQARSRSRRCGAVGCSPRSTGCGSSSRCGPSTPGRRRSTSATNAASPGSTRSTTRSPGSGRWSCPAPRATRCTSWTPCSTSTPARNPEMVTTDNASYSDMVFGVFAILGLPLRAPLRRPGRPAVLARGCPTGYRTVSTCHPSSGDVRAAGADRPQHDQHREDRHPVAGHAASRRLAGHQPGPRLRSAAHVRPRRTPHPARAGVRSSTAGSPRRCTCWPSSTQSTAPTSGG